MLPVMVCSLVIPSLVTLSLSRFCDCQRTSTLPDYVSVGETSIVGNNGHIGHM
jgi:hypothetical protein